VAGLGVRRRLFPVCGRRARVQALDPAAGLRKCIKELVTVIPREGAGWK
jgi:hypothetical protein